MKNIIITLLFVAVGFAFIYVPTGMCQLSFDYHAWSFNTRSAAVVWGVFFGLCGLVVAVLVNNNKK